MKSLLHKWKGNSSALEHDIFRITFMQTSALISVFWMGIISSYFCFTFQRLNPLSLKNNAEIIFTMFSENWTLYFRQCPKTGYEEVNIVVVCRHCCISNDWFFGMMAVVEDSQWLFSVKVSYRDVHHRNDSRSHFIVISKVSWRWLRPSRVGFGLGIVMISMITKYP